MKKTLSALLLLPLVAAAFIACSGDDDTETGQTAKKTVTFTAAFDPQTRVTYIDGTNTETGNPQIKSRWDESDLNNTVKFKDASDNVYEFTISSIGDGGLTATLTYDGDFPETFTGTATYEVEAATEQRQTANGSLSENVADATAHLNAGTKLVSTLPSDIDGTTIKFHHAQTSLYRIAFTAPAAIAQGSKLIMKANAKTIGEVTLDFAVAEGTKLVAYMRGATQAATTKLTYTLIDGDETYSYIKEMSSKDLVEGKYYYANLESEKIYHYSKAEYDVRGNAEVDMETSDFGIRLDKDGNVTTDPDKAVTKLLLGDRFLGASTPGGRDILYFYWGEIEGHRADALGNLILNSGDASTFQYYHQDPVAGFAYNKSTSDLMTAGWLDYNPNAPEDFQYALKKERDGVNYHLGGNWRMMGYKEAEAFKNSIDCELNSDKTGLVFYKKANRDIKFEMSFVGVMLNKKIVASEDFPVANNPTFRSCFTWMREDHNSDDHNSYVFGANKNFQGTPFNYYMTSSQSFNGTVANIRGLFL